jgi:DNA-binding NtrC family response regulator
VTKGLVFVVDDDASICTLVETVLRDEGYAVQTFLRSDEVLAALVLAHPETVLFDLWMEEPAGPDLYARMRHLDARPTYVLMSAATDAAKIAADLGIPLLAKPFDLEQLIELAARAPNAAV